MKVSQRLCALGVGLLLCLFGVVACGSTEPEMPTPQAFEYKVVSEKVEKRKAINRTRLRVEVIPVGNPTLTKQSLGDTAIRVAQDKAKLSKADVFFVSVYQSTDPTLMSQFQPQAMATYCRDGRDIGGKGQKTWEVMAANGPVLDKYITMTKLWMQEKGKFQTPVVINGKVLEGETLTDEPKLIAHLSKMTGVAEDQVSLGGVETMLHPYFKQ